MRIGPENIWSKFFSLLTELLTKCWCILETGKSIFYTNAVVNFLKMYLLSENYNSSEKLKTFLQKMEKHLDRVKDNILSGGQDPNEQLTSSCLKLLVLYPDFVKTIEVEAVTCLVKSLDVLVCGSSMKIWNLALDVLLVFTK